MSDENLKVKEDIFTELISEGIISVEDNRLKILKSIDITTYGSRAWAFTLQEIGKAKDANYLYRMGYLMGDDSARQMLEVLQKMKSFVTPKMADIKNIIQIAGFGIVEIKEENNNVIITIEKNHIIDLAKEMYQENSMVCDFYRGIYGAIINVFKNTDIELKQTSCKCKNNTECRFEGKV